jgi:nucleotide-binding universal stress UspA family protein
VNLQSRCGTNFAKAKSMIPTIRKTLVSTDFSESSQRAFGYAAALAKSFDASLHLVHVLEESFSPRRGRQVYGANGRYDRAYDACRALLGAAAQSLAHASERISTEVREGTPAEEIISAAIDYGADVIVMATHGRTGLSHLVLGSVAEEVIHRARCPVLAVRHSGAAGVHAGPKVA